MEFLSLKTVPGYFCQVITICRSSALLRVLGNFGRCEFDPKAEIEGSDVYLHVYSAVFSFATIAVSCSARRIQLTAKALWHSPSSTYGNCVVVTRPQ
jgi:hypothetical protein